jgi:hypothetical protein
MMSIYGRLGYNFDSSKFGDALYFTDGVSAYMNSTPLLLKTWQVGDIANNTASGYYQNPHNDVLATLAIFVGGISSYANTEYYIYNEAPDSANNLANVAGPTTTSLTDFAIHTNNISGVTNSTDTSVYPDLNMAMGVGREMLTLTNKSDGVQNNVPILGNFTSLYINSDLIELNSRLANDYIMLSNSFVETGNTSNISNADVNMILSDVEELKTLLDTRRNGDIAFYQNSYAVLRDYQTVSQFSVIGATQNSLIQLIGTDKLKEDLGQTT